MAWTNLNHVARVFRYLWSGMLQGNMKDKQERFHPTQKPIELMEWCLSFKDGLILDPFFGSGTTGVACEKLNRKWIGIEISPEYCEMAKKRILAEYNQTKMFQDTDKADTGGGK